MSTQRRPVQQYITVCDLCDESLEGERSEKRASLVHAYRHQKNGLARAWYLLWNPRDWPGRGAPTWNEMQADPKKWATRHYDFHTECILRLVEDAIDAKKEETR